MKPLLISQPPFRLSDRSAVEHYFLMLFLGLSWAVAFGITLGAGYLLWVWVWEWAETGNGWAALQASLGLISFGYALRWVVLLYLYVLESHDRYFSPPPEPSVWPTLSIILPFYNEKELIAQAMQSTLDLDYPHYEVIAVSDGSTDGSYEIAKKFEGDYSFGSVRVYAKSNGGKVSALNYAFQKTSGEWIISIDGDGKIDPDAAKQLIRRALSCEGVDAVAGYTRVWNRINLLTRCQAAEFIIWNGVVRGPQSRHGCVLCIPGPLGLFRRSALLRIEQWFGIRLDATEHRPNGPFEPDTFAEDFDLSLALLMTGSKILYEPRAGSDTDAMPTMLTLINQRYRWARGSLQVIRKLLRRGLSRPEWQRANVWAWLCGSYLYDFAVFTFALFAQLVVVFVAFSGHESLDLFLACLIAQTLLRLFVSIAAIIEHKESWRLLWYVLFIDVYGLILAGAFLIALFDEIRGGRMRW
ncbi:MAG: glycosyltransferase [Gemmataceae bacterium]|nr:glycosyltransferase [Gemmataceae bacterium]